MAGGRSNKCVKILNVTTTLAANRGNVCVHRKMHTMSIN